MGYGINMDLPATGSGFTSGAGEYSAAGGGGTPGAGGGEGSPDNWWTKMFAGQQQFLDQVLGGFTTMGGGFDDMLDGFLSSGTATFDQLAGSITKLGSGLSSLFGGLTQSGGPAGGIGGSMGKAMGFLAPVGSILTAGLGLFKGIKSLFGGGKKRRLASPLMNFSDYHSSTNSTVNNSSRSVNVYINGQTLKSAVEVDRTLGRAGVDRSLRDQIKELVRSGTNPAA